MYDEGFFSRRDIIPEYSPFQSESSPIQRLKQPFLSNELIMSPIAAM